MRRTAVIFLWGPAVLGAVLATGCGRRRLDSGGPGTGTLDAGGAGQAGGGGAGAGAAGASGPAGAGGGSGGVGGSIPPGGPKMKGDACASGPECATGFCTDGVCCEGACAGGCQRCNIPGLVGDCIPLSIGAAPKRSDACPVEIALTCGADGTCDGVGACRLRVEGTICGGGSCDGDAVIGRMTCDGLGNCLGGGTTICVPYRCDPATAACRSSCATDADCVGTYCDSSGRCHVGARELCTSNAECASGFCVNGICCNTACTDPCMACNLPNHEGACTPRPGCAVPDAGSD